MLNIVQTLMKNYQIEPRMVREEREQQGEKTQKDGFTVKRATKNIIYGVDTTAKTRKLMLELLPEIIDSEYDKIISPRLYEDIAGLERKKTGKVEHSETSHDDNLMSYLIFRYALHHGKCLKEKFKINAIPSSSNIKTVSSTADILRIDSILQAATRASDLASVNNDVFNYLVRREEMLKEETDMSSSLQRILDLNK